MSLLVLLPVVAHGQAATYQVTFQGQWTTDATPGGVPAGAHFSPLIGAVHNDQVTFWQSGETASAGMESMAEVGGTSTLRAEINASTHTHAVIERSGNIDATATVTIDVTLTPASPLVTLVSMIAPSPDWFVGVSKLSLRTAQHTWLTSHAVDLFPYDAGTEEGTEFDLTNAATSPQGTITSLTGRGKFSNEPIATLTFTLQAVKPEITSATTFTVNEGRTPVTTLTAQDQDTDRGDLTWSKVGGADADKFTLTSAGVLTFTTVPDYEAPTDADADNVYEVTVTVSDGTHMVTADIEVKVDNVVELATVILGPTTVDHAENRALRVAAYTAAASPEDQKEVVWSLEGDDAEEFTIADGILRFDLTNGLPDHETPADMDTDNVYQVTVQAAASDSATPIPLAVTVTVTDQNEAGSLSLDSFQPRLGRALTATLADPDDITPNTTTWQWVRATGLNTWTDIASATSSSYTPTAADTGYYLRVTASYTDSFGAGQMAVAVAPHVVIGDTLRQLSMTTTGSGRGMYPSFNAETLHYAAECATGIWTLTLSTQDSATRLAVNGRQTANQNAEIELSGLHGESDIEIVLSNTDGASTTYIIHCIDADFPDVAVEKQAGAWEGLISAGFGRRRRSWGYIALFDNNGVPRFRRKFDHRLTRFQYHRTGKYPFHFFRPAQEKAVEWEAAILDEKLNIVDTAATVAPLTNTDAHDFIIKENGNYVFIAYEPIRREVSYFGTTATHNLEDSIIQEVTPEGRMVFLWNSFDHMAIEDCRQNIWPGDWGHMNSLQLLDDGDIVTSLRGCSQVLRIDRPSGNVVWRLGRSNLSSRQWADKWPDGRGRAPLALRGDPALEFCGQHSATLLPNGHVLLFDNGNHCIRDENGNPSGRGNAKFARFSRSVEYALDPENDEAIFIRDHTEGGTRAKFSLASGQVKPMDNGHWLTSWGRSVPEEDEVDNPFPPGPHRVSVTQWDPAAEEELLSMTFTDRVENQRYNVNAFPVSPVVVADSPAPLIAQIPESVSASTFHPGASGRPQVVVAFSRPVLTFEKDTPSVSVTGATVGSVAPHAVAGEPANAYLFTLEPADGGAVTFALVADQACADGGICTADGTTLSAVPATHTIPGLVTVSFGEPVYTVTEGRTAGVLARLNRAHGRADGVEIPLVVGNGGTAAATDYTLLTTVTFAADETLQMVSVATEEDRLAEDEETVELMFGTLPAGVNPGAYTETTLKIRDNDTAQVALTLNPREVVEGSRVDVTVAIINGVTFAAPQTFELAFSGSATRGMDYTVVATSLTLEAKRSSVRTTLSVTDDATQEEPETIRLEVRHRDRQVAARTATIRANDRLDAQSAVPEIAIFAGPSPTGGARGASFTLTRTGATTAALTVSVSVTESGSMLAATPPTQVTFQAGAGSTTLHVPTVDDSVVTSETSVVTASVDDSSTNAYQVVATTRSAQVTVQDDEAAEFAVFVSPPSVTEGTTAQVVVSITNGVTFATDQVLALVFGGNAERGADYTVESEMLTLAAGQSFVATVISVADDGAKEPAETIQVVAQHAGTPVDREALTIAASEDTKPPTLEHAEVSRDGRTLRLIFSEPLDEAERHRPAATAFTILVAGDTREVTAVAVNGEIVTLGLIDPVMPGQEVTVSYTAPTGSPAPAALQDPAGHEVVSFADKAVENQAVRRPVVTRPPSGGGGGGGPACAEDVHGNQPTQATVIALSTVTPGAICPAADVDYFTVTAPGQGLLFVDTTGSMNTRGTLWQDGAVLPSGTLRGRPDERVGARVEAGEVVVAVQGQGGATGAYKVSVTFTPGYLENPGADSFQSGVGVLSGWVCAADQVEIEIGNTGRQAAAYGTERLDTAGVCGDTDNGFGLLFNWNLLSDGEHEVVALVDGVELGRASVTVTTLGQEFLRGATGTCAAEDFPTVGETVTLVWQQNSQNFVIAGGRPPAGATTGRTTALTGYLENPGPNSFQSGIGVLSGWVCAAEAVEIEITTETGAVARHMAAYGTERVDTQDACGDTNNGFGLLFNWNLLRDGEHEVIAYVDGEELGRATVQVTTLGAEFLRGVEGECVVEDFPTMGETVTLEWQQNQQNFVITDVE